MDIQNLSFSQSGHNTLLDLLGPVAQGNEASVPFNRVLAQSSNATSVKPPPHTAASGKPDAMREDTAISRSTVAGNTSSETESETASRSETESGSVDPSSARKKETQSGSEARAESRTESSPEETQEGVEDGKKLPEEGQFLALDTEQEDSETEDNTEFDEAMLPFPAQQNRMDMAGRRETVETPRRDGRGISLKAEQVSETSSRETKTLDTAGVKTGVPETRLDGERSLMSTGDKPGTDQLFQQLQANASAMAAGKGGENGVSTTTPATAAMPVSAAGVEKAGTLPSPVAATRVLPSLQNPGWGDAVAHRVMVMAASHNRVAHLQIDPPDLGPVEVRIDYQRDTAHVTMVTHSNQVRDALEQSLGRLREMFAQQGIDLGQADVETRDQGSGFSGQQAPQVVRSVRETSLADETLEPTRVTNIRVSSNLVDYFA